MGESSFWCRPTRVVPDQRPLNGRCAISIGNTFENSIGIEYRWYFLEVSLTSLDGALHNEHVRLSICWNKWCGTDHWLPHLYGHPTFQMQTSLTMWCRGFYKTMFTKSRSRTWKSVVACRGVTSEWLTLQTEACAAVCSWCRTFQICTLNITHVCQKAADWRLRKKWWSRLLHKVYISNFKFHKIVQQLSEW